jgi:hypothetical protein
MTSRRKNARPLDTIADNIHRLRRENIFEIGDLLLEARTQCEHGQWLDWLDAEFDWSVDTAENYMASAALVSKFRTVRNLKLPATTLYRLADHDEAELPAIIDELAKHATKNRLRARDAERVIKIGIGRRRFGDHPDATLVQLVDLENWYGAEPWCEQAIMAVKARSPVSDDDVKTIIDEISEAAARKAEDEALRPIEPEDAAEDVDDILNGPPPVLPPATATPELQKLGADTEWQGRESFSDAVENLRELITKPAGRFAGVFPPDELREVADFLMAVAATEKKAAA